MDLPEFFSISLSPLERYRHDEEDGHRHGRLLRGVEQVGEQHQVEVGRVVEARSEMVFLFNRTSGQG